MFKVECPGCKASYNVDERRVRPDTGLKMRCPKCSHAFTVRLPSETAADDDELLPAVGAKRAVPTKPQEPMRADLPTLAGPRAVAAKAALDLEIDLPALTGGDLPAAKKGAPPPPPRPPLGKPTAPAMPAVSNKAPEGPSRGATVLGVAPPQGGDDELLLPAVRSAPKPFAKPAPPGAAKSSPFDELDLPSPQMSAPSPGSIHRRVTVQNPDELNLPALAVDLPSPGRGPVRSPPPPPRVPPRAPTKPTAPSFEELEEGLPAKRTVTAGRSPRQVTGGALFDDFDLPSPPADLPAARVQGDLPAARAQGDLPAARKGSDLPAAKGSGDLPSPRGRADLPATRGDLDLPSLSLDTALPAPRGNANLPMAKQDAGFGELDLPIVQPTGRNLPAAAKPSAPAPRPSTVPDLASAASFLPQATSASAPPRGRSGPPSAFDEFGLEGESAAPDDFEAPLGKLSAPPPMNFPSSAPMEAAPADDFFSTPESAPPPPAALHRQQGGGVSFGEVNLGGDDNVAPAPLPSSVPPPAAGGDLGWGERDLGGGSSSADADDDMEFGAIPQERKSGAPPPAAPSRPPSMVPPQSAPVVRVRGAERPEAPAPPKPGRTLRIAAIALSLVVLGGGALMFTPYGAFGYYVAFDALKKKEFDALQKATEQTVRAELAKDTADAAGRGLFAADNAHVQAPRARGVAAYGAYAGFLRELRFGHDAAVHAHAKGLLAEVPTDMTSTAIELARAAQTAAGDQLAKGQSMTDALLRRAPADPDALALSGEVGLAVKDADKALAAFTKLAETEASPRARFGVARAELAKGDRASAEASAKKVLATSPSHAGARILLATMAWDATHDETSTLAQLDPVLKDPAARATASATELVSAYTLLGRIQLRKSRVTAAEAAFNEALKLDPKAAGALSGVGEALYRAGRHAEALARFNSAVEADPEAIEPKLGVAKTKIALERLQEAKDLLKNLAKKLKDDGKPSFQVVSWLGRSEEALGDKVAAEADYNEAIKLAGNDSDIVDTYVWLAQVLSGQGRTQEAETRLTDAKSKLPKSVALYTALGDIAFQAGRYDEAERDFTAALAMDESDLSTRFKLGITLRRMSKFDAAATAFDKVAELDKDYPGLSLERAVLFESAGQSQKALELYQAALAKAPDDPDLMLRVAAALLASGQKPQAQKAEDLLRKVFQQRQNSAEANHFMGRALLLKGTNLHEALKYLARATELDPNHAEYWLYVGWAANEADDQGKARAALDRALELDKSLADAYWQRGVLRRRQRAVVDAELDLHKALELRPSRYEAYATLAEVYEDQQKWPQALAAWQKAIAANGERAEWRFRLGKLMTQNGNRAGAYEHLAKAVELAGQMESPAPWLGDACLLLADAERGAGKRAEAIEHYQKFLSLAPSDSPYVRDACIALGTLGQPCKPK